ncbi:MAG: class I SAM-dependent methyltransferase [Acidimicrobiales bacterium]
MSAEAPGTFSCVVDRHPRFHKEALRWYACLTEAAGVDPADLVVHTVGGSSSDALDRLVSAGVTVRAVEPFDGRSPHCNKISGALALADKGVDGLAVLCDTDIAVLEDPRRVAVADDAMAAKTVDAPVPSLEVLQSVFIAAGIDAPPPVPLPWGPGEQTLAGNANGGLYLVPGALLGRLSAAWARWARWLLDRTELLAGWAVHVDQVAMALALRAEGVTPLTLEVRWNTPTHDLARIPADPPAPAVLHYHQRVNTEGLIELTGSAAIDGQVDRANRAIASASAKTSPTVACEGRRLPPDGSPEVAGNRPSVLPTRLLDALRPSRVLELRAGAVTGDRAADLVVVPEPLAPSALGDRNVIAGLWRSTGRALVVSIHADERSVGALRSTFALVASDAELYPLPDSRDRGGLGHRRMLVLRAPLPRHPRDYGAGSLDAIVDRHPDPVALAELRLHAWDTLGFYPDHAPRLWEYPVVAGLIRSRLAGGGRLVDIGAGVTPLPSFLTGQGFVVDTVDSSDIRRTWPPEPDWNEWDFLDYGHAGLAHRSWNTTLGELPWRPAFDGAYSVSVIEHMPAADRRSLLAEVSSRVRQGGLVVLTIDLVRGEDTLWNRNRGIAVEDPATHGTFSDIVDECGEVGLELDAEERVRDWGKVDVDIGLLVLVQRRQPSTSRWRRTLGRLAGRTA